MKYTDPIVPDNYIVKTNTFDYQLEGLRGFVALIVVLSHIFGNSNFLDLSYKQEGIFLYMPPGHLGVIVFFILSGYVIGITNKPPIDTNYKRIIYLKKRLTRLFPIYLISILITLAVAAKVSHFYSIKTIALHLLFGQVAFTHVFSENLPLWSLSFEMLYYIFFLLVSNFKWRADFTALFLLLAGIVCRYSPGIPSVVTAYLYGGSIWMIGVVLANRTRLEEKLQYGKMLAFLVLFLSFSRMNLANSVLDHLNIDFTSEQVPYFPEHAVSFSDFSNLVFCLPLLCLFTNRTFIGLIWLERLAFTIPGLYSVLYFTSGKIHNPALFNTFFLAFVCYLISLLIYLLNIYFYTIGNKIIYKLVYFGGISYGIYVIHFPIIFLFQQISCLSGSVYTFVLRCVFYLITVLVLGWFLEKRIQPWFKAHL